MTIHIIPRNLIPILNLGGNISSLYQKWSMISIDNIGVGLSSPGAIFKNYNKSYLNLPSIFTRKIFPCVKCLRNFFNLTPKTLKLNISGSTEGKNMKKIYSCSLHLGDSNVVVVVVRGLSLPGSAVWVDSIGAYWYGNVVIMFLIVWEILSQTFWVYYQSCSGLFGGFRDCSRLFGFVRSCSGGII